MARIHVCIGLLVCFLFAGTASDAFSVDSAALAILELPVPKSPDARKYLGISKSGNFRVSEITSEVVIVEVFSMYCPYCQADALNVNELYKLIESDPALKRRIRMIGIGTGNTPFEVEVFRKKYDVKFPLFPDEGFSVQKISSEPIRTPTFITLRRKADKSFTILDTHIGETKEAGAFLKKILDGVNRK
ncbi:MAG: redoxin domain-containing protein [Desulfomonile tiedjei]|uniref:Redoxin domain-containing protein n=1 Tax=Desulfomonile tiedjei TaxID=2358 RepID=A0A9D6V0B3_9BACT|nr:redoxin domain-containing protein [Desulfomonile tiedjei]